MLQWYAMVRDDLSTRVASSRHHQVPTTDIISARWCRCRLYCHFPPASSNMSSRPCCEIHSRISRACQRFRKHGWDCCLCFPSLGKQPISVFTASIRVSWMRLSPMKFYQTRRWQGWRRQRRWAKSCRWTSWRCPMWLRWSWKLCRWTWKLENIIWCWCFF